MPPMSDDLAKRRRERLSPEGRRLFDDMMAESRAGAPPEARMGEFMERMDGLPDADRAELRSLLESISRALLTEAEEAARIGLSAREAERVFEAAHAKLRAEGKAADPEMTLEEAYRVLEEEAMEREYETIWRAKGIADGAQTVDHIIGALLEAVEGLRAMQEDGIELSGEVQDDYAFLRTTDPAIAEKHGLQETDFGEDEDDL